MKERVVPRKNYVMLLLMVVLVVGLTFAVFNIASAIKNKKVNAGYINKYVSELQYVELDNYLVEPANNTFIYLTYTGDNDIYNLETKLKKLINNYELESNFIYVNVTEEMNNDNFINSLNDKVSANGIIEKLPVILYYKDGTLTEVLQGENNIFSVADFQKLLDKYEIAS